MNDPKVESELVVLLTIRELAALLKISERSIWRLVSSGQIVKPIRIGGSIRWRVKDVSEWINGDRSGEQGPKAK